MDIPNTEKKFTLLYKLTKDGSNCSDFHSKCDKKGPTLVIIQSNTGYKCGGYTIVDWDLSGGYKKDELAFLFSINKNKKYPIKKGCESNAIWTGQNYGPLFGAHDIRFYLDMKKDITNNYCNTPISYQTTEKSELTGGQYNFLVQEMEVFKVEFI